MSGTSVPSAAVKGATKACSVGPTRSAATQRQLSSATAMHAASEAAIHLVEGAITPNQHVTAADAAQPALQIE